MPAANDPEDIHKVDLPFSHAATKKLYGTWIQAYLQHGTWPRWT